MRHIELGASYQCLQVPILEDIAHVEGVPDPEPHTLFLVDHHVFSNCDRQDVFTYNDEKEDGNGNGIMNRRPLKGNLQESPRRTLKRTRQKQLRQGVRVCRRKHT